jgi:hypothetical protein
MVPRFLSVVFILSWAAPAWALLIGVNIHGDTSSAVADVMKANNLRTARMDVTAASDSAAVRAQATRIKANGGKVEVSLQISYQWDNSCNQNFAAVEQNSYNETAALVNIYKDVIADYELLNEISLRTETIAEVPWNTAGVSTSPYAGKPCYATMTSVLRGMSRAVHDIGSSSGLPLRVILGAVGRDFGFLSYMQQQGVAIDVVGFHVYPHLDDASLPSDPWYGTGGPFVRLAAFHLPVHVNEFDCGEIYDAGYDNLPGSASTNACLQSYQKHLPTFFTQTVMNLESLALYELLDEPGKSGAEGRFGLMYDINTPKAQLAAVAAFAASATTPKAPRNLRFAP